MGGKDLLGALLGDAVGQWELEVLDEQLLNVWPADIGRLLYLDDLENLQTS